MTALSRAIAVALLGLLAVLVAVAIAVSPVGASSAGSSCIPGADRSACAAESGDELGDEQSLLQTHHVQQRLQAHDVSHQVPSDKVTPGAIVTLSRSGKFCSASTGILVCDAASAGPMEKFEVLSGVLNGRVALRVLGSRKYCSDDNDFVRCDRVFVDDWERFSAFAQDANSVVLKGGRGLMYCTDQAGGVACNRVAVEAGSVFNVSTVGTVPQESCVFKAGAVVTLTGKRLGLACGESSGRIVCDGTVTGPAQQFQVLDGGNGRIALRAVAAAKYCADDLDRVLCTRDVVDTWERFVFFQEGNQLMLKGGRSNLFCTDTAAGVSCLEQSVIPTAYFGLQCPGLTTTQAAATTPMATTTTTTTTAAGSCTLKPGIMVALTGNRAGLFCSSRTDRLICDSSTLGASERFEVVDGGSGTIALRGTVNGKFCADQTDRVICDRSVVNTWERFTAIPDGSRVLLKGGRGGKYCSDTAAFVVCTTDIVGTPERFGLQCLGPVTTTQAVPTTATTTTTRTATATTTGATTTTTTTTAATTSAVTGVTTTAPPGCSERGNKLYKRVWTAAGKTFFDDWDFLQSDYNHGAAQYLARDAAFNYKVVEAFDTHAIMRSGPKGWLYKRMSFKLATRQSWKYHLSVMRFSHVPYGCGTWTAFWTHAPSKIWPEGGELDILEHVNDQLGQVSLHTGESNKCKLYSPEVNRCKPMPDTNGKVWDDYDCVTAYPTRLGCGPNAGPLKNGEQWAKNPGIIATEMTEAFVKVFFIPEVQIPADIDADAPRPDSWDEWLISYYPFRASNAANASLCPNPADIMAPQQMILNLNFCGDWAAKVWGTSGCPASVPNAPNCRAVDPLFEFNPQQDCCTQWIWDENNTFGTDEYLRTRAFFNISYIKVYQQ